MNITTPFLSTTLLAASALALAGTETPETGPISPTTSPDEPNARPARAIDVDLDGQPELLVTLPDGRLTLVRESSPGVLEDCSAEFGLGALPPTRRALFHDIDGNGTPDLFAIGLDGSAHLLRNELGAGFADVTTASGLERLAGVRSAEWVDADGDGTAELLLRSSAGLSLHRHVGEFVFEAARLPLDDEAILPILPAVEANPTGASTTPEEAGPVRSADLGETAVSQAPPEGPRKDEPTQRSTRTPLPTWTTPGPPPVGPSTQALGGSALCAKTLLDQATGACLRASSTPELGKLYPISSDLFVDAATGRVGIGDTTPAARLDVQATSEIGLSVSGATGLQAAALFSSNTNPNIPTLSSFVGSGGTSGYFQGQISIGKNFFGLPLHTILLGEGLAGSGQLLMKNGSGRTNLTIVTEEGVGNGAQIELGMDDGTTTISLDAEAGSLASKLGMHNRAGTETVEILSQEAAGNGAQIVLRKDNGVATVVLDAETSVAAEISLRNSTGLETIEMLTEEVAGDGAQIVLRKADGTASIILDAEQGTNGRITTETLEITGGADLVESFETASLCAPGTVVSIDPENPGSLRASSEAYDPRVAGIVSGAGGVRPGLHLGQNGMLQGDTPVALTGRVYVRCTSENGSIQPGDLLTTSSTPGCAMRATDPERAFGAVIGKAMGRLEGEEGLVLVLVTLQ